MSRSRGSGMVGEHRLLDAREVARRLSVCRSTAYNLMMSGQLPTVRIGRKLVRVSSVALDKWIEDRAQAAS